MGTGYGALLQVFIGRSIHFSHVSMSPNNLLWLALSLGKLTLNFTYCYLLQAVCYIQYKLHYKGSLILFSHHLFLLHKDNYVTQQNLTLNVVEIGIFLLFSD